MGKKIIIAVIIIAVLAAGFFVIKSRNSGTTEATANAVLVNMVQAEEESLTTKVTADGNVSAAEDETIKARLSGLVEEVLVESGDRVEKGDSIYRIDDKPLNNSLETARLNLQEAQGSYDSLLKKYKNQDQLNKLQLEESQRNLDIAILSYKQEKASLEDQKNKLEKQLEDAEDNLGKTEEKLEENKYLYNKSAISKNTLEQSREAYDQALRNKETIENDLKIFTEKTMPNTLELNQLKIDNARNQLTYQKASIESQKITEKDLEQARLQITRAENQIDEIKDNLDKIVTTAPISGTVINLELKAGDKLVEGTTVGSLADLSSFIVEAMVDEIDINEVKVGQSAVITSDSFEKDLDGEITFIAPASTKVGNLNKYRTEITIADDMGLLRPGMFVNAEIVTNRKDNAVAVPTLAVLGDDGKYVWIDKDGKAEKRNVELGLKTLSKVEIIGVEAGEDVIIGPYTVINEMKEGTAVEPVKNDKNAQDK